MTIGAIFSGVRRNLFKRLKFPHITIIKMCYKLHKKLKTGTNK